MRRILSNSTYVGDMEQGRVRKLNYKSKKTIRLPRDEWIIVPGTHEGIISRRRFAAVQKQLAARSRAAHGETQHPLAGLVRCGMCGGKMELTGSGPRRYSPLLYSGQEPRGLSGAAISANARLRKAGADQTANLYTPAADLCPGARADTNYYRQLARKRPTHDKNNLALLTAV